MSIQKSNDGLNIINASLLGANFVESDLIPFTTATYSLGNSTNQWKNGQFSGTVTAANFVGGIPAGNLTDTTNLYQNNSDHTKLLQFDLSGETTAKKQILALSNTNNSTLTLPNVTSDTLVSQTTGSFTADMTLTKATPAFTMTGTNGANLNIVGGMGNGTTLNMTNVVGNAAVINMTTGASTGWSISQFNNTMHIDDNFHSVAIFMPTTLGGNGIFVVDNATQTLSNKTLTSATTTISGVTATRPLKVDASNIITSALIDLTSSNDVTGVLPIANGGTNDATGNSIMAKELIELIPWYQYSTNAGTTRALPIATFEGYEYYLFHPITPTQIYFSLSLATVPSQIDVGIYQRAGGIHANTGNPASLRASGFMTPVGTGGQIVTITTGTGILQNGVIYILIGAETGGAGLTIRAYGNINAIPNTNPQDAGYGASSFSTVIATSSSFASTFDPTAQTPISTGVPIFRLRC